MPRRRGFDVDFDFNILTALKGGVGLAPQGPGALHIIILKLNDYTEPHPHIKN